MKDEPAAIRASFSDFRLIKSRKVCQLVMEIPIEGADAALAALGGVPQPHSERWLAVARLNGASAINEGLPPDETSEISQDPQPKNNIAYGELASKEKRKWDDLTLREQAVMRCKEGAFRKYLNEDVQHLHGSIKTEADAANYIRELCRVSSRRELNTNIEAGCSWESLDHCYQAWLKVAE